MVNDTNYHVTPRLLRMHAEFICEQIDFEHRRPADQMR